MTAYGEQKIYVNSRKGFVKLALQYGAHLIPMVRPLIVLIILSTLTILMVLSIPKYAFGENESYYSLNILMGFRKWLQANFHLGIPLCYGRWGSLIPNKGRMHVEVRFSVV